MSSQVFISYKRSDEARVARVVQGLEQVGFKVWWDRDLPHDQGWRDRIASELARSACVLAIWTDASTQPLDGNNFMLEEAGEAKQRGLLVAARLDRVRAPLGFREAAQPVDLIDWKGRTDDPFFVDLCDTLKAKIEGRPAPVPKGHRLRWRQRLAWGSLAGALSTGTVVVTVPTVVSPTSVCASGMLQPGLSDLCGRFGIGQRPTREERVAWEGREPASCTALREHVARFPDGHFRSQAADLLAARQVIQRERWSPTARELTMYVGTAESVAPTESAARIAAGNVAQAQADRLCRGFAATTLYKFLGAKAEVPQWKCANDVRGVSCSGEGRAVCDVQERHLEQLERCAGQ